MGDPEIVTHLLGYTGCFGHPSSPECVTRGNRI